MDLKQVKCRRNKSWQSTWAHQFHYGVSQLESKFDSTLLPLELASKDGINRGGKTRKDKSTRFWLDLKKKGNTLPIVLHFLVENIKNYIVHSHVTHTIFLKSLEQQIVRCTQ
jgi:hypothetical protein